MKRIGKKKILVGAFAVSFSLGLAIWLLAGTLLVATTTGCSGEEDCLVWGENCTQNYIHNTYGDKDIRCCSGQCNDHGSGILTCGS